MQPQPSNKIGPAKPLASALALLALLLLACGTLPRTALAPASTTRQPTALLPTLGITRMRATAINNEPTSISLPTITETSVLVTGTATSNPTTTPASTRAASGVYDCQLSPAVETLAEQVQTEPWLAWIRQLSGAEPVTLDGKQVTITTRFTPAMFADRAKPGAFDYVLATVRGWYPDSQIEVQPFAMKMRDGETVKGKNLILTLPGANRAAQPVLLTAHLDDRAAISDSMTRAPGADDNASGSAALLEAARLLHDRRLEHPLRLIWFTGEEQGLLGSQAYVGSLHNPEQILGDINLDMFAYDGDQDDLFEVHAGKLPASAQLAGCFTQAYTAANHLPADPLPFELLTDQAIGASDHGSFWAAGVPAIEISENILPPAGDFNPNYHSAKDTVDRIDPAMGIRIVRGALSAAASLAGLLP